jgi:hypothetical protein
MEPRWPHEYIDLWTRPHLQESLGTGGYLVYRRAFDTDRCTLEDGAVAHKVAVFVTESEAANYCHYRNHMTTISGTDDVEKIDFRAHVQPPITR